MNISNISQKASSFIQHKSFHPGNWKNIRKICEAEYNEEQNQIKIAQLLDKKKQLYFFEKIESLSVKNPINWNIDNSENLLNECGDDKKNQINLDFALAERTQYGNVDDNDIKVKLMHDPLFKIKLAIEGQDKKKKNDVSSKVCKNSNTKKLYKDKLDKLRKLKKLAV